jgi:membrane protein
MNTPLTLPRHTWKDTLVRTVKEFKADKLNHWAAALTYYAVLSLFPALLVLVSLVGVFADPERVTKVLTDTISEMGPATAATTFQGPIESITGSRGTAGIMLVVGVIGALWAASGYVSAFADASNTIYEVQEGRPFWKLKPLQLAVTFVLILLAAMVALSLVLSGPIVGALGSSLGVSDTALAVWRLAKWPAMVLLVLIIFGTLYYTSPNARPTGVTWVTSGAVLAVVLWVVASVALAF